MKFTIFHLADSHWIPEYKHAADLSKSRPTRTETIFYEEYELALKRTVLNLRIGDDEGDVAVVVHTGDFANFYIKELQDQPVGMQFNDIAARHLPKIREIFSCAKHFLAVPGNHDTNVKDGNEELSVKFADFKRCLHDWYTTFSENPPVLRIPIPGTSNKSIALFLFNSAASVYESHAESAAVPFASVRGVYRVTPTKSDYLNVAILHHNVLPQYGVVAGTTSNQVFVDNGDFNAYLTKERFKLVLTGHQHLDNDVSFSIADPLPTDERIHMIPENTVLALSAPSFLRHEYGTEPGFNFIEITLSEKSPVANLKITRYRYNLLASAFYPKSITKHILVMPRFEDVCEPLGLGPRMEIYSTFLEKMYDKDVTTEEIQYAISPPDPEDHFERVREAISQASALAINNIFGMYSVAIMPPSTWMVHQRTFHYLFTTNAERAIQRTVQNGYNQDYLYSFSFSKPVYKAITQAALNAKATSVAERFSNDLQLIQESKIRHFLSLFYDAPGGTLSRWKGASVSRNDPSDPKKEGIQAIWNQRARLRFECNNQDIPEVFSSPNFDRYPIEPYEIARILLWAPETFADYRAFELIKFHEENHVPLFWLNPKSLIGQTNEYRNEIGYALLYTHKFGERGDNQTTTSSQPLQFLNNIVGKNMSGHVTQAQTRLGSPSSLDVALWGRNGAPEYYRRRHTHLAAEFCALLYRPDILFALDAFAMFMTQDLDSVEKELQHTYGFCDGWLTSPTLS